MTQAFHTAIESIKPNDGVYAGMFHRRKDELKENVEIAHGILNGGKLWTISVYNSQLKFACPAGTTDLGKALVPFC